MWKHFYVLLKTRTNITISFSHFSFVCACVFYFYFSFVWIIGILFPTCQIILMDVTHMHLNKSTYMYFQFSVFLIRLLPKRGDYLYLITLHFCLFQLPGKKITECYNLYPISVLQCLLHIRKAFWMILFWDFAIFFS